MAMAPTAKQQTGAGAASPSAPWPSGWRPPGLSPSGSGDLNASALGARHCELLRRARGEHRGLPPLPARAGRRARRAAHRRPHECADRHPRRGPRGAHARRDRLDLLLAELRRPRDDELPHRQRHAAPARGPRALGAGSSPNRRRSRGPWRRRCASIRRSASGGA